MAQYDDGAQTHGNALELLVITAQRVIDHHHKNPGRHIGCRIVLDLPEPPHDTDPPDPLEPA